jgi:hypothetical protein
MGEQPQNNEVKRIMPQSGLDFNMMLTDTMWGSPYVSKQIKEKIKQRVTTRDGTIDKEAAWELLSFYTRDVRLANLNVLTGEVTYCQYYLDLAGDFLREGFPEAFATSLARAATVLELSQSKNGFLRKRQNTLTTESLSGEVEPPKKRLLFGSKKNG